MQELINKITQVYLFAVSNADEATKIRIVQQAQALVGKYDDTIKELLEPPEGKGKGKEKAEDYLKLIEAVNTATKEARDELVIPEFDKDIKEHISSKLASEITELQVHALSLLTALEKHYYENGIKKELHAYKNNLEILYQGLIETPEELANLYTNMIPGTLDSNTGSFGSSLNFRKDPNVGSSGSTGTKSSGSSIPTPAGVKPVSEQQLNAFSNTPIPPTPPIEGAKLIDPIEDGPNITAVMQELDAIYIHELLIAIRKAITELEAYVGHKTELATAKARYETSFKEISPAIAYLLNLSEEAIEKNKIDGVAEDTTQIKNRLMLAREAQEELIAEAKRIYEIALNKLDPSERTLKKLWDNKEILRHAWKYTQAQKTLAQIDRALALNENNNEQVQAMDAQIKRLTTHLAELSSPKTKESLPGNIPIPKATANPNTIIEQEGDSELKAISTLLKAYLKVLGVAHADEVNNANVKEIPGTQIKIPLIQSKGPEAELLGNNLLRSHLPAMLSRLENMDKILQAFLEKAKEDAKTLTNANEIKANLLEQEQIQSYLNYIPMLQAWITHHKPKEQQTHLAYYGEHPTYIEGDTQADRMKVAYKKAIEYLAKHDKTVSENDEESIKIFDISGTPSNSSVVKTIIERKGEQVLYGEGKISLAHSAVDAGDKNKVLHYVSLQYKNPTNDALRTAILLSEKDLNLLGTLPPYDPAVMAVAYKIVQTHASKLAESDEVNNPDEWKIHKGKLPDSVYKAIFIACKLQGIDAVTPSVVNPRTGKTQPQSRLGDDDQDFLRAEANLKSEKYLQVTQDKTFTHRAELQRAEAQFDQEFPEQLDESSLRPRSGP